LRNQYCLYTLFNFATAFLSSLPTCSGTSIACTHHTTLPLHFASFFQLVQEPVLPVHLYNFATSSCVISFSLFRNQSCLYTWHDFATAVCIICFNLSGLSYISCIGLHISLQVGASLGLSASHRQAVEVPSSVAPLWCLLVESYLLCGNKHTITFQLIKSCDIIDMVSETHQTLFRHDWMTSDYGCAMAWLHS
jgi:hypothetical protein